MCAAENEGMDGGLQGNRTGHAMLSCCTVPN